MKLVSLAALLVLVAVIALPAFAQNNGNSSHNPTWWNKYLYLLNHPADSLAGPGTSLSVGANVDVSNECGPQTDTFIPINPRAPSLLAPGSNEIFRDPMPGYFSTTTGPTS